MTRRRLGDLVPVGCVVERETHRVAAPAQDVEGRARVPQRLVLLARGAEGHDHMGPVDGVVDPEDVREGPRAHPPPGAYPSVLLVGVREGEAQSAEAPLDVGRHVVGEAADGRGDRRRLRRPTDGRVGPRGRQTRRHPLAHRSRQLRASWNTAERTRRPAHRGGLGELSPRVRGVRRPR